MDQNVTLMISGLHTESKIEDNGGDEEIQTVVPAEYFYRGDAHYVLYEESSESCEESTRSRIKFKNGVLELTRKGFIDTRMVFEEGRQHESCYVMPYGRFIMGIDTKKITFEEAADSIRITVEYALEMNGLHQADSRIAIVIKENKRAAV
ncbi:MAG: DUF1934 domain-containing protein [Bacteroidales bacterium]|nr:DUF1934 domain-containing protein [Lachnoclostridium sp.]MCM1383983.1 DUF1934 domain-containing protein [Lachnoclostridium sp.]MCM1464692.1 DUF1934 domain-containing protein [Bacteroidales bacterium]